MIHILIKYLGMILCQIAISKDGQAFLDLCLVEWMDFDTCHHQLSL